MDKRFEDWVLEEIRTHPEVLKIEASQQVLYAKYGEGDEWTVEDDELALGLKANHAMECSRARAAAEAFWAEVRPGRAFLHKRYITADRQPERCVVTKLEYCRHECLFLVYYRTADGEGMRTKVEPMYFRRESFKEWA